MKVSNDERRNSYEKYRKWLFRMDPERAHGLGLTAGRIGQRVAPAGIRNAFAFDDPMLEQWVWRTRITSPIGFAAGFDKNAMVIELAELIGCGYTEVGSVTARRSRGNPRPRAFRLPADEAVINRMGLNNHGARRIAARIKRRGDGIPLGVNIAKTHDPRIMGDDAIADFVASFKRLAPLADYITLNVSCPNTREGKTFEEPESFEKLISAISSERAALKKDVPVLVKLSPPVTDRVVFDSDTEAIVELSRHFGIDGFVACNTASDRSGLTTPEDELRAIGAGGLSGPPVEERTNQLIRYLYERTEGSMVIIGVGGIRDGESAYRKIRAGASLLQVYTALIYQGPGVIQRIKQELVDRLKADGFNRIVDAVGADITSGEPRFGNPSVSRPARLS